MGCDIHSIAQKKVDGVWETLDLKPFDWRSYDLFGFMADVRNLSAVPPLATCRGLPDDLVKRRIDDDAIVQGWSGDEPDLPWYLGDHSFSWLSVKELLDFDYDQVFEDRRLKIGPNMWGGSTVDPGLGEEKTYREFLGPMFFKELMKLRMSGAERIVFGFDN